MGARRRRAEGVCMSVKAQVFSGQANGGQLSQAFQLTSSRQLIQVSGTAWTQTPNTTISFEVEVTGNGAPAVSGTATMYANQANVHMTLPTLALATSLPVGGPYTLRISPGPGTTFDANDCFTIVVLELDASPNNL